VGSFRLIRINEQLKEEISRLIISGVIKDPRVTTFLSVNRVDVTSDLGFAKVWVSSFVSDKRLEKGVEGLQSAAGFIQTTLGKKLRLRQFPKLTFVADSSIKEGFEMIKKLDSLSEHSVGQAAATETAGAQ
jgi:ribosome-binding factor A